MRSLLVSVFFFLAISIRIIAQSPPGIPYQAEVRSENGEVLANANANVRFTFHELTANGTVSYQETHAVITNELGLFATVIGTGTATQGTFSAINWPQTIKFLQVEVDAGTGYITIGNQQIMSVPYALYATNSQQGPQGPVGPAGTPGPAGEEGIGISSTQIVNDSLIVNYTNNQSQNVGKVRVSIIAGNGINLNGDTLSVSGGNTLQNSPNLTGRSNIGFARSGTWQCPQGVRQVMIQLWGAGGGGGGGSAILNPGGTGFVGCNQNGCWRGRFGGNGGKGGYHRSIVSVTPGNTYQVLVGIGGVGGLGAVGGCTSGGSGQSGSNGGNSVFTDGAITHIALGGAGGAGAATSAGDCSQAGNGASGLISNYSANEISVAINSITSSLSYIPSGYVTTLISPSAQAAGGGGGAPTTAGTCGCISPASPGANGEDGFCIISY